MDILGTCWQRGPCQLALSGQGQMKSTGSPGSGGGRAKPFATCDMHGAWRADDDCEERRVVSNYHLSERLYSTCSFWSDALQSFVSTERPYKVNIISFPRGGNDDFQRLNISLKWHICLMVELGSLLLQRSFSWPPHQPAFHVRECGILLGYTLKFAVPWNSKET